MEDGFPIKQNSLASLDEISLNNLKREFAYALLRNPSSCLAAAQEVFPFDASTALKVSDIWPHDPTVVRYKYEIKQQEGEELFLPSKTDFLTKIWDRINQPNPITDNDEFVKLATLYGKARGFIEEKVNQNATNINFGESAKVMIVTNAGTDDEWQAKAMANQQKLLNGNQTGMDANT